MAKPKAKSGKQSATKKTGKSTTFKNKKAPQKKNTFKKKNKINKENEANKDHVKKEKIDDKKRKLPVEDVEQSKKVKKEKSETVSQLMAIYEKLRRKDTTSEERLKMIDQVVVVAEGKENEVVFKHGTVRVLEMCVKYGQEEQKERIFQIFKDNLVVLLTSKYAKFLVEKFIEYGSKDQKKKIIEAFYGKVKKLIKDKGASQILEEIYCKYANASQRAALVEEFYGPEYAVFKVASGRTLEDILGNEPDKKERVLNHMKESLSTLCQKDALALSVIHRALLDFFKYANTQQKTELVEILKSSLVQILHTKDGSKVAINCIWHATTKDRKVITKSFKTFVKKICMEEFGHMVLFSLFDVMDDTVLLKKALFPEILSSLEDLLVDQYGRKVLLYIMKPRHSSCFLPEVTKFLQEGDGNPHSKKDISVRQQELRDILLPDLFDCLANNAKDIILNKSTAVVLLAALEVAKDSPKAIVLMEKIASIVGKPLKSLERENEEGETEEVPTTAHPIVDACGHWLVKSIIKQDKQRKEHGCENLFSMILCDHVPTGCFTDWSTENRGAFVLVSLLESGIESVVSRVKADLKFLHQSKDNKENSKGFDILTKLLTS